MDFLGFLSLIPQGVAMPPSHSQQRQEAMQQVYVSDKGDDKHDGLSQEAPIKSLKRLCILWSGRELVLMEGREGVRQDRRRDGCLREFADGEAKNVPQR